MRPALRLLALAGLVWPFAVAACSSDTTGALSGGSGNDASGGGDDGGGTTSPDGAIVDGGGTPDGGGGTPDGGPNGNALTFTCAVTKAPPAPSACPAPSGAAGHASFCFRAQWSGVTGVDVYGGFGQASDWTQPFVSLTGDGTGTFTATAALANGTYPYMYRVHGSADGLVKDGQYLLDQENPQFVPPPAQAPLKRSVSSVTVPQVAAPIFHVRGKVAFAGAAQPCFAVDLEAGELLKAGGGVLSEHTTANFAESAADGTFDFPVAPGPFQVIVRYPFKLDADAGYPDPTTTPSVGIARTGLTVAAADVALDPADVAYPAADYAKMAPTGGTATLPVTFTYSIVPGSTAASVAVIGTTVAGNDPLYWGPFTATTSATWDGAFGGNAGNAKLGTTYYWGAWQKSAPAANGTVWTTESLLFPITFQ